VPSFCQFLKKLDNEIFDGTSVPDITALLLYYASYYLLMHKYPGKHFIAAG
jgi:hypothetical protein